MTMDYQGLAILIAAIGSLITVIVGSVANVLTVRNGKKTDAAIAKLANVEVVAGEAVAKIAKVEVVAVQAVAKIETVQTTTNEVHAITNSRTDQLIAEAVETAKEMATLKAEMAEVKKLLAAALEAKQTPKGQKGRP